MLPAGPEPTSDDGGTVVDSTSVGTDGSLDGSSTGTESSGDVGVACPSPALDSTDVLQLGDTEFRGNPDGTVTIVEWLGFKDRYSATAYWTVRELMALPQFEGQLRLAIKHVPFGSHPKGLPAARAALAAHRQGQQWAYHDLLFEYDGELDADALEALAIEAGLDLEQFHADIDSPAVDEQLDADRHLAELVFGSLATPTFVFNGARLTGAQTLDVFTETVASELAATEALLAEGFTLCEAYEKRLEENLSPQ